MRIQTVKTINEKYIQYIKNWDEYKWKFVMGDNEELIFFYSDDNRNLIKSIVVISENGSKTNLLNYILYFKNKNDK